MMGKYKTRAKTARRREISRNSMKKKRELDGGQVKNIKICKGYCHQQIIMIEKLEEELEK